MESVEEGSPRLPPVDPSNPDTVPKFVDPVPIPEVLPPVGMECGKTSLPGDHERSKAEASPRLHSYDCLGV